jgi:hypothetical protein
VFSQEGVSIEARAGNEVGFGGDRAGFGGLIAWPYLRAAPGPADEFLMVCVATGEVFEMHVEDAPMIPAANPKTERGR